MKIKDIGHELSIMEPIYYLKDRAGVFMYHWVIYMLGGLRHITNIQQKYHIYIEKYAALSFQEESLKLLGDKYIFDKDPPNNAIVLEGEPLVAPGDNVNPETFFFLRNLFLNRLPAAQVDGSKIYICRKKISEGHASISGSIMKRQILNEDEYVGDLQQMGFKVIQLEDYTFQEKCAIFQKARLIVGPNSGGLVLSLLMSPNAKLVEICPEGAHITNHYKNICLALNIPFIRYSPAEIIGDPSCIDNVWNMRINREHFLNFLAAL